MDIVKVFGTNLKNIAPRSAFLRRHSPTNAVCTAPTSARLNVIDAAFRWKTFSVSLTRSRLNHISFFWRNRDGILHP